MRTVALLVVFSHSWAVLASFNISEPAFFEIKIDRDHPEKIYKAFEEFKRKYNRKYKDEAETQQRFNNFVNSYKDVDRLNAKAKASGYNTVFGINKFADLSRHEFNSRLSSVPPNNTGIPEIDFSNGLFRQSDNEKKEQYNSRVSKDNATRVKRRSTRYPEYFDLRQHEVNGHKIVGRVKDQAGCGCCWGFAITALLETVNAVNSDKFVSLSDQEVCDCGTEGLPGCKGGSLNLGAKYVRAYGLSSEYEYPFDEERAKVSRKCRVRETKRIVQPRVFNYALVSPHKAEKQIMEVLTKWKVPVAVYFRVGENFKNYQGGVIVEDDCRRNEEEVSWHAGVIIGYDTIDHGGRSYDYWIVKNSWGVPSDWGESGYFNVIRGKNWCKLESSPITGDLKRRNSY